MRHLATTLGCLSLFLVSPSGIAAETTADPGIKLADDGAWTWFNDPRALFHNGTLYVGFVRIADGKTALNACDVEKETHTTLFTSDFSQRDDHNNPGLVPLADGRLAAFYCRHSPDKFSEYRISLNSTPATPDDWGPTRKITGLTSVSYQNPYQLSAENGRIYNFMRSKNYNPCFSASDDNGETWRETHFIKFGKGGTRPYVKYTSNYRDRIDVFYSDGHPRNYRNSLYHLFTRGRNVYDTGGKKIKSFDQLPLEHAEGERGSVVYQYSDEPGDNPDDHIPGGRAWCWDLAYGKDGNPVAVFSVQVDDPEKNWENDRIYYYHARFIPGKGWQKRFIAHAGRPLYDREDDYAGGIAIDPKDPSLVYISSNASSPFDLAKLSPSPLSENNRYELYRGKLNAGGTAFDWTPLTRNSDKDNFRPYVPRGDNPYSESVLFFHGTYSSYVRYRTEIRGIFKK